MQLLCQTVGRNGFSVPRALWQVHCGRIDSCVGGKWIVITCLFLMTLGWAASDLLQFGIGLASRLPRLAVREDVSRLFRGQEPSHSEVTRHSSREPRLWSWALFPLCAYSNITRPVGRTAVVEGRGGERGQAALLGTDVDPLWELEAQRINTTCCLH